MAESSSWPLDRRVFVEDTRRDGSFLRVTWHADSQQFVVSHWDGDLCVAATRVPVDAAPDLIALLTRGLAEVAGQSPKPDSQTA